MKIERTTHRAWTEAYRCTAGLAELIVVTSIGPRILSLRCDGGENLLYEDSTDFKVGAWRLQGGHRFTVAPESDASYVPDNRPCHVAVEPDRLCIEQQLNDGLLRRLEITADADHAGFMLRHVLRNCRAQPWHGAAWAVTCLPPTGRIVVPKSDVPARFWTQPGERYADASSQQWRSADGCLVVEPNGEKGKLGLCSERGWLAHLHRGITFVIRGPERVAQAAYPDDGCNVEVYTCARYLELETLGPLTTLLPGQELFHEQHWQVFPRTFAPSAWRAIDRFVQPSRARVRQVHATAC